MPNKQMKTLTIGGETYDIHDAVARGRSGGFSDTAKAALLNLLEHVAYTDENGQTYFEALESALTTKVITSISAVFTQGQAVIYDNANLDSLKQYLVVTANYDDGSSAEVESYTLSGTLTVGTSTISVAYSGKSATFEVTVTAAPTLSSISAEFTQGQTVVYDTDSLDSLKSMLVVTATYSDSSTEVVDAADYTLTGTLAEGTSIITVSYGGKTDTFNVTVESAFYSQYTEYDYIQVVDDKGSALAPSKWMILKQYENLNILSIELAVKPLSGHYNGGAIIGRRNLGTSGADYSLGLYAKTGLLSWQLHGSTPASDAYRPALNEDAVNIVYYQNTSESPSSIRTNNNSPISVSWTNNNVLNLAPMLFGNPSGSGTNVISLVEKIQCGYVKFFDLSGNLISHYVPAVRISDNRIGMYDLVEKEFYTTETANVSTEGASGCVYAVGDWS